MNVARFVELLLATALGVTIGITQYWALLVCAAVFAIWMAFVNMQAMTEVPK